MVVTNRKIPLCYNKWDYFHLENTREQVLERPAFHKQVRNFHYNF